MDTLLDQRYRLEDEIARGAIGVVWRALDVRTGERVAVKVLRAEPDEGQDLAGALRAEGELLAGLDHPGVVKVREFTTIGDIPALVMDLVPGKDLRRRVRGDGPLAAAVVARVGAGVADVLAYLHGRGVVHGDVKAGNVLLVAAEGDVAGGGVRVVDFGVARRVGECAGPLHATPEYAAPEVAAGTPGGPAADVYALGILLYELTCGRTPFYGDAPIVVLARHTTGVAVPAPGMPGELWEVIEACLRRERGERPSAEYVARRLRAVVPVVRDMPALPPLGEEAVTWWPRAVDETAPLPVPLRRVDWVPLPAAPVSPASGCLGRLVPVPVTGAPGTGPGGTGGAGGAGRRAEPVGPRREARWLRRPVVAVVIGVAAALIGLATATALLLSAASARGQDGPGHRARTVGVVVSDPAEPPVAASDGTFGTDRPVAATTGGGAGTGYTGRTTAPAARGTTAAGGLPGGIGDPMPTMPGWPGR